MASSTTLTDAESSSTIYQPLKPEVRPHLDPEYVAFHEKYTQYVEPDDVRPWHPIHTRFRKPFPPGTSVPVPVRQTEDIQLSNFPVRVFRPNGERPKNGWPVLVWYHGGGWAIGTVESENDFCSRMCRDANCVVVTVGYRLAPEHQYPAQVDDALEALLWVHGAGSSVLDIDPSRIAIGGTSAGGNLSVVTLLKASSLPQPIPIIFQLLIVPVIDNTATESTIWASRAKAPWLTPARMTSYRNMYLPDPATDARNWDASPNLAPSELLAKTSKTWVAIAEQDLLAPEGLAFADQLQSLGVEVEVAKYEGMTHSILAMNGILSKGKQLVDDAARVLKDAFDQQNLS